MTIPEIKEKSMKPLPCPFCGEQPLISKHYKEEMWNLIHRCKIVGPIAIDWKEAVETLLDRWNMRKPLPCAHSRWDWQPGCLKVRCLRCGAILKATKNHARHRPYELCDNPDCPQCCMREE
jgi:hypothetical protein